MRDMKILSIKDAILLVKEILSKFNITIPAEQEFLLEKDISDYALELYSKKDSSSLGPVA